MNSKQILDREYLTLRAKILEIAASLDRIERADGDVSDDDRVNEVRKFDEDSGWERWLGFETCRQIELLLPIFFVGM